MLTVDTATPTLLSLKLISGQAIVSGDLSIKSEARRNRNLRVQQRQGTGYLVKQPEDAGARATIRAEAEFYSLCSKEDVCCAARNFLPTLALFDAETNILFLELLEPACNLWPLYSDVENMGRAVEACNLLGYALATIHATFHAPSLRTYLDRLRHHTPWILQVHRPSPGLMASISPANYETLSIIQGEPDVCRRLDELEESWQGLTLIHGDIKGDNILWVTSKSSSQGSIKIVDWELVQRGDPAWDVAGYFQDVLLYWLSSLPQGDSVEDMIAKGKRPLRTLQPLLRAFWRGYSAVAGRNNETNVLLSRSVRYTGGRLIQSAYEMSSIASALPLRAILTLQLSANLLDDPESAQVQLLGIFDDL